jgi:hypothetical protein
LGFRLIVAQPDYFCALEAKRRRIDDYRCCWSPQLRCDGMSRVTVTLLSLATTAMRVSKSLREKSLRELLERHRPRNLTLRSVNLQDADAMPSSLSLGFSPSRLSTNVQHLFNISHSQESHPMSSASLTLLDLLVCCLPLESLDKILLLLHFFSPRANL